MIDLGPEGGAEGGWIVAQGGLGDIIAQPKSYTGKMLRELLTGREGIGLPGSNIDLGEEPEPS